MNHRQAKRIALAVNASYILFGAETAAVTDYLPDVDADRYRLAQAEMAQEMLRRAGFTEPMQAGEIVAAVLAQ